MNIMNTKQSWTYAIATALNALKKIMNVYGIEDHQIHSGSEMILFTMHTYLISAFNM